MLDFEIGNSAVQGYAMCHVESMDIATSLFGELWGLESELGVSMEVAMDSDGEVAAKYTVSGFGPNLQYRDTMRKMADVFARYSPVNLEALVVRREVDGEEERASIADGDLFFSRIVAGVDTLDEVYTNGTSHYV